MKQTTLLLNLFFFCLSANAQTIEWQYEVEAKVKTIPQYFWVDEAGNGFYNIREENPDRPGDANYGSFLLMLDKNGNFKRTTRINNCEKTVQLLPFGESQLISSGYVCTNGDSISKNTQLFDYSGKRKREGNSHFPGNYFASIPINGEFTFFSKPTKRWAYTYISIGKIDKDLNTSYQKVPLDNIKDTSYGIVNTYVDPVLSANGTWVIPMQYGTVRNSGLSIEPKHGIAMGVRNEEIVWQYPLNKSNHRVRGVCAHGDKIGVLRSKGKGHFPFAILDQNGKVLKELELPWRSRSFIRGVAMTDKEIIIQTTNALLRYSIEGQLLNSLKYSDLNMRNGNRIQLLEDGSVIVSARRNENAVIIKISFDDAKEAALESEIEALENEIVTEQKTEAKNQITYSSIDKSFDKSILSATVYPNPTAAFIHFDFERPVGQMNEFDIQIFSLNGKLVHSKTANQIGQPIDVQSLAGGTYMYRISVNGEKQLMSGRFVKVD